MVEIHMRALSLFSLTRIALTLVLTAAVAVAGDPVVELDVKPFGYGHSSRVGLSGFKANGDFNAAVESARTDYGGPGSSASCTPATATPTATSR